MSHAPIKSHQKRLERFTGFFVVKNKRGQGRQGVKGLNGRCHVLRVLIDV